MKTVGVSSVGVVLILLTGILATGYSYQHGRGNVIPWSEFNPFSCAQREAGYYADYSRACQTFYRCVENYPQPFRFECGPGTRFDERINNCNHAAQVPCY